MASPIPQPTALKLARGNPGKRALNKREPKPTVGLPSCPEYLEEEARTLWERLGTHLVRLGIMTELDGPALADLIEAEILTRRISQALAVSALLQETTSVDGAGIEHVEVKSHPLVKMRVELMRERRAQHAQFGLTPATRSKLASNADAGDPLEDLLH